MPQQLSEAPGKPYHQPFGIHVPYTIWIAATPVGSKRQEIEHWFKKTADKIETALSNYCSSGTVTFDYTKPIAYTHQFGDKAPRFTVNGHLCVRDTFIKSHAGTTTVVNTNERVDGGFRLTADKLSTTAEFNTIVKDFKDGIETETGYQVTRLEIAGVIFGDGGVTFPR